jgi:hypothetical protein
MASVAGVACDGDVAQVEVHAHHAPSEKTPDQSHAAHVCHSVCAACALLSTAVAVLPFALAQTFNNDIIAVVPSLELPVQERPPRFI